ncbi:hypothetical protein [Nioella sp.]
MSALLSLTFCRVPINCLLQGLADIEGHRPGRYADAIRHSIVIPTGQKPI